MAEGGCGHRDYVPFGTGASVNVPSAPVMAEVFSDAPGSNPVPFVGLELIATATPAIGFPVLSWTDPVIRPVGGGGV